MFFSSTMVTVIQYAQSPQPPIRAQGT